MGVRGEDSGAIYFLGRDGADTGNVVSYNYVNGAGPQSAGNIKCLYLDDMMSNITANGNILANCGNFGLIVHGGNNNSFTDNVFNLGSGQTFFYQDCDTAAGSCSAASSVNFGMNNNSFTNNIVYLSGSIPSSLWTVIDQSVSDSPDQNLR